MRKISPDPDVLLSLPRLMGKPRRDVLYAGTATPYENFVFCRYGNTPWNERLSVCVNLLRDIEEEMLQLRVATSGGRYFVTSEGAFYKNRDNQRHWFVAFV